jgi:hypothetical protein
MPTCRQNECCRGTEKIWRKCYLVRPGIIKIIKSRRMRWAGNVARMGEKRNAYRLLVGKRPLGRPKT